MFNWYPIFKKQAFLDTGLVSKEYPVLITGVGFKTVLATSGVGVSILVDGVFLMINTNEKNPFRIGEYAVFLDPLDTVWLGIYNED